MQYEIVPPELPSVIEVEVKSTIAGAQILAGLFTTKIGNGFTTMFNVELLAH